MTAFGFRWYGPEDAVTLEHIRQIPPVTELVTSLYHIPAGALWPEEDIAARAAQSAAAGLHFSVAEGLPVHESIKLGGPERERYIGQFVENLERLARHGVHTVCYNFMPLFGWIRTELEQPLPDGSATLAFHQAALERMNPERDVWTLPGWNFSTRQGEIRTLLGQYRALGEAGLWNNLRYFLQAGIWPAPGGIHAGGSAPPDRRGGSAIQRCDAVHRLPGQQQGQRCGQDCRPPLCGGQNSLCPRAECPLGGGGGLL